MKNISIIIPFDKGRVRLPRYISWIKGALYNINSNTASTIDNYEIILITNNPDNISLKNIQIFPKKAPVNLYVDKEQKGINELSVKGISLAKYDLIGIIDAHADYPALILEKIFKEITSKSDVIAAFKADPKYFRRIKGREEFSPVTTRFLFDLHKNPKAGALFFSRIVWDAISFTPTESKFYLEFLVRSQQAGYTLKKYDIDQIGEHLVRKSLRKSLNAAIDVLSLKIREIPPVMIPSIDDKSMINAGFRYKKQKYVTHTTLGKNQSALGVLGLRQLVIFGIIVECVGIAVVLSPLLFAQIIIAVLSTVYLIDVFFNLYLVLRNIRGSSELTFTNEELQKINDRELPYYSILCPLYKEAHMLPQFLEGIAQLNWPKKKLDVILLFEEDDLSSIEAFKKMRLPTYIRMVIVPHSFPKTKPKACNYGLAFVKGKYSVIFDAEDMPDPMQLKKAYLGFKKSSRKVVCLQAKLSYYNIKQNLLTRFFTVEYSLWFGMTLSGLQSLNTTIPLGGTSNHFRTSDLKKLLAWDPFNVTEDADLGMRLFKLGYQTAMLDSVTLEEGNSNVRNWIRQRSRWIKGYMQTYLVHTREGMSFVRKRGVHALFFHLVIGGKIAFIFINPVLWIVTLLYFSMYSVFGPTIDTFYPQAVLYIAITSLIFGNYLYLFCHIMGCVKNKQWGLIKYVYIIPIYWVLISIAGAIALYQLLFKPFYWEKTIHGLHLKKKSDASSTDSADLPRNILPGELNLFKSS